MRIQLFRDTEFCNRFDNWIKIVKNLQASYAWRMFDQFQFSVGFGYFIYDNNLSDLTPYFSRDYFANNWTSILAAFEIAGTFEAYLLIIRSALGAETQVSFENPEPSHLIINIINPTGAVQFAAYHNHETVDIIPNQTALPNSTLNFLQGVAPLTVNETIKLIDLLNVSGVWVEVNFTI